MPSSRIPSQPRDQTVSLASPTLAGGCFTTSTTWEAKMIHSLMLTPLLDCPAPELKPGEERKESKEPRDFWAGGVVTLAAEGPWQLGLWAGWSQLRSGPWLAEGLPAQRQKRLPSLPRLRIYEVKSLGWWAEAIDQLNGHKRGPGRWWELVCRGQDQRTQSLNPGAAGRNMQCGGAVLR